MPLDRKNIDLYTFLAMKNQNITNKLLFVALFSVLGFILSQISFTKLVGSSLSFNLFDFFAPTAGAFLGGPVGIVSVLIVNLVNFAIKGVSFQPAVLVRLVTNLFAVWYFSLSADKKTNKAILVVPVIAMLLFWANPVGRQVWYFALFWLIPIAAFFKRDVLFIKSLGATFMAHAVGGAAWIWALNLPAVAWKGLIPVVIFERLSFALGITASYVILTYVFKYLESKKLIPSGLQLKTPTKHIFS